MVGRGHMEQGLVGHVIWGKGGLRVLVAGMAPVGEADGAGSIGDVAGSLA